MCLNLVCFTWSNFYKALKSPISNVDFMAIAPHFDSMTDLKVYDLNFIIIFVVALCRKGVLSIQKIASRCSPNFRLLVVAGKANELLEFSSSMVLLAPDLISSITD